MTQDEIIEMARQAELVKTIDCCGVVNKFCSQDQWKGNLSVFAKLVAAKEREHWKEIVDGQLRCITALNDIVGGEGSTTTKNILDYSRMEEMIKEAVAKEREALTPRCWTTEMNDAWNKAIPDLTLDFDELIRAKGEA